MAGLTSAGFEIKTIEDLLLEIETEQKAELGASLNTEADSALGQVNRILASKIAELWELAQAVYASQYPDTSSGISLDRVTALTGMSRTEASKSRVVVRCSGTNTTVIPAGRRVATDPAGDAFVSLADGTISGGFVDIEFEAEEAGEVLANAGTVTEILTAVSGWTSCTNLADADPLGAEEETDAALRLRRLLALAATGDATDDAIRSDILNVEGVTAAFVYSNDSDTEDADGVPAHAIECVVLGGDDQDIVDAIHGAKAAGILAYGTDSGTATDAQGDPHVIGFTRPEELVVVVEVEVLTNALTFPVTGEQQIKDALAAVVADFSIGQDVIRNALFAPILAIAGVIDVTTLEIAFDGDALDTDNLPVSTRQLATLDTSDVTVSAP